MFGIDDALIWAPIGGAALGALTSKNPLKGAALGGAMGYGGAALPGLLTSGTATPAVAGIADGAAATFAPMSASDFMQAQIANSATSPATPGLLSADSLKGAVDNYVRPIGTAMSTGMAAKGLLSEPQQQVQASPIMQQGGGSAALTQLAQQNQQQTQNELDQAAQARALRRQIYRGGN